MIGAITLCVSVSVFIALPSSWGGPTVDPVGISVSTSSTDSLTAPHALAPMSLRVASVVRVGIVVLAMLIAAAIAVRNDRHDRPGDSRHGSTFMRSVMQRRGPPALTLSPT